MATAFERKIFECIKRIPAGKVAAYTGIAIAIGNPHSARAVGNACGNNTDYENVPCHRIVCSDGRIGNYNRGAKKKAELLGTEGINVRKGRIMGFKEKIVVATALSSLARR